MGRGDEKKNDTGLNSAPAPVPASTPVPGSTFGLHAPADLSRAALAIPVPVAGLQRTNSHSASPSGTIVGQPSPSLRASLIFITAAPTGGAATNLMAAAAGSGMAAPAQRSVARHRQFSKAFTSLKLAPSLTKQLYLLLERAIYYANSISFWAEYSLERSNLTAKTSGTAINESLPELYLEDASKFDTANIVGNIPTGIYQLLQIFKEKRDDNIDEKEMLSLFQITKKEASQQCQKRKAELAIKRDFPFCCCSIENTDDLVIKFLDLMANVPIKDISKVALDDLYKKIMAIDPNLVSQPDFYTKGFGQLQPIPQSPNVSNSK